MRDIIGFFDSGVGGLSVLHTARRVLPRENFLYLGDNGHAPYGTKTLEEIRSLTASGIASLLSRDVKAIVIACNTATSAYAEILRSKTDIPIIGMEPAIKPAQLARRNGSILALATQATLSLPKFERLMAAYGDGVIPVTGDGFVELVEENRMDTAEAFEVIHNVLSPFLTQSIDSIVLGCTHYPFLIRSIRKCFPSVAIHDGRLGTALQLKRLLENRGLLTDGNTGSVVLETTGGAKTLSLMQTLLNYLDHHEKDSNNYTQPPRI